MSREIVRTSLLEQVTAQLRREILDGSLSPDEHHSASALARRMGVSRTPVREAILALERDGLVRIIPNRGIRILTAGLEDIVDSFELRLLLEIPTVVRSVERIDRIAMRSIREAFERMENAAGRSATEELLVADRDFHAVLLAGHGNQQVLRVLAEVRNHVIAGGAATIPQSRSHQDLVEEHRPILEAALRKDALGAGEAMRDHIVKTASLLIERLASAEEADPDPWTSRLHAAAILA